MKKAFYVFRRLFSRLGGQTVLLWLLMTSVCFTMTYVATIFHTYANISYYAPASEGMQDWLLCNIRSDAVPMGIGRGDKGLRLNEKVDAEIRALPGVEKTADIYWPYYQPSASDPNSFMITAYHSEMLTALGVRDAEDRRIDASPRAGESRSPFWVDYRLRDEYPLGAEYSLQALCWGMGRDLPDVRFYVAGYLNKKSIVPHIISAYSNETLESMMDLSGERYRMILVSDAFEGDEAMQRFAMQVKGIRVSGGAQAREEEIDRQLRGKGLGTCIAYQTIVDQYDVWISHLTSNNTAKVWFMLPMSFIALIGLQALLFDRLRRLNAVMNLCGMPARAWIGGWLMLLAALLLLPLALGFAMFVVLQRLSIVYPLVISLPPRLIFLVPIGAILFAFCFLSVLPTIISVLRSKPIDLLREAEQ